MVSIFAEDVYDETIQVSFSNVPGNGRLDDVVLNFPTSPATSLVGGFAYIESFTVETDVTGSFTVDNQRPDGGGFDPVGIQIRPSYIFDGKLDIFGTVSQGQIQWENGVNEATISDPSGSASFVLDSYVDVPADIGIEAELYSGVFEAESGSFDLNVKVSVVGRKP
jgi:hypothetical protein